MPRRAGPRPRADGRRDGRPEGDDLRAVEQDQEQPSGQATTYMGGPGLVDTLGVRLVVPLGLCSLPAFVCLGVIPILVGLFPAFTAP